MRPQRLGRLLLAIGAGTSVLVTAIVCAATADEPRIQRIEGDMRPALQIRGRPVDRQTLTQLMGIHHTPSISVAVVENGRISWTRAYGLADAEAHKPATPRTIYQAGSISKPVAASAVLQLVQEGRLRLDTPVNNSLKSWQIPDSPLTREHPVTLRQLLTHTAGLGVHGFPGYAAGVPVPTVIQVLEGKTPANSAPVLVEKQPGVAWNYSGGGYTIVQLLLTDTDGRTFPQLMQERVLSPAGMAASSYEQPLPMPRYPDAANGYLSNGSKVEGRSHTYPEMAAAGLWATPSDLARWAIALERSYNGEPNSLLSKKSAREMLTPGLGNWGLGIDVEHIGDEIKFEHSGDTWGFKARLIGWPKGARAMVAMANGDDADAVLDSLTQAIAREYGWKGLDQRIIDLFNLSDSQRQELIGGWRQGKSVLQIRADGDKLQGQYQGIRFEVIPQSPDLLIAGGSELKTIRGPDNKIIALDAGGFGRFEREPASN